MKLREILPSDAEFDAHHADLDIGAVTADSRTVKRGSLFVAIPGTKADGLGFVSAAIAAGAAAIVAAQRPQAPLPSNVAFVHVPNARRALALIAAKLFPRQPGTITAVTGTSGKTSVAAFTRQIWTALGHQAASIGTVGIVAPRGETYGSLTTPDPVALHRSIDELAGEGVTHLAIEASSHGLDQSRLDGLRISAGGFTNITRDHLDYHPSFDAYLEAKLRLFAVLLAPGAPAVIYADHDHADRVVATAKARGLSIMTVGHKGSGIRLVDTAIDGFAQTMRVEHERRPIRSTCRWSASFRSRMRWSQPGSPSQPAARPVGFSRRWKICPAPRGGSNASARVAVRRFSSITRTSPTRSPRRSMRCGPT
jgi:UDP-N-acetylmuramoyl-L-alanyl-D-glutamate--2,6-diaminopimelate ligase